MARVSMYELRDMGILAEINRLVLEPAGLRVSIVETYGQGPSYLLFERPEGAPTVHRDPPDRCSTDPEAT